MAPLTINLLGGFSAWRDRQAIALGSRRTEALLAYLVLSGRPHHREHLADLLWDTGDRRKAAGNLRVLLTNLRHAVGEYVEIDRAFVAFRPAGPGEVTVDLLAFRTQIEEPLRRPVEDLTDKDLEALDSALGLCRGDVLERLELAHCSRFDGWLALERKAFHDEHVLVLTRIAEAELARGSTEAAARHAAALVEVDPLSEPAHQLAILARLAAGDELAALRQYDDLARMLGTELNTKPSAASSRLVEGLPRADPLVTTAHILSPSATAPGPHQDERPPWSHFVARQDELGTILERFADAERGRGRIVIVRGEPGSGKTTLLRQAVHVLAKSDPSLVVLGGSCSDSGLLLGHMLCQLKGDCSVPWLDAPMPSDVAARLRQLPPTGGSGHEGKAAEAANAVRQLATLHPVAVVLDDMQWCAAGGLAVVEDLARDLRSKRLLLLVSARPQAFVPARHSPGSPGWMLTRLGRTQGTTYIELDHDEARATAFVRALLASEPSDLPTDFSGELLTHGRGHPLVTVEILRELVRTELLVADTASPYRLQRPVDWGQVAVPNRVGLMFDELLFDVPQDLFPLLELAAGQGPEFSAVRVAESCGRPVADVLAAFGNELGRYLGLVEPVAKNASGEAPTHRFRHPMMRDHLLARMDGLQRSQVVRDMAGGRLG